jgi:predicted nucleic acid-binding protein
VKAETVDKGKAEGYTDAIAIEKAISSGWIKVAKTKSNAEKLAEETKIGRSEAEAIPLAKEMKTEKLLIDDARARNVAQSLGLKPHGTIYILKLALVRKMISKTEYAQLLRKALNAGLYLSTELYLQALKEAE